MVQLTDEPDIVINEYVFEKDHHSRHREHPEIEVEIDFNASGDDLTDLIQNADAKASEIAQGRSHYIWRIMADESGVGLDAECTMYVMVPRVSFPGRTYSERLDG